MTISLMQKKRKERTHNEIEKVMKELKQEADDIETSLQD